MYEDIDLGDGETIRVMNMLPQEYYRVAAPSLTAPSASLTMGKNNNF
jgi:hypothetical protein